MSQQLKSLVEGRRLFLKKTIGSGALLATPALLFRAGAAVADSVSSAAPAIIASRKDIPQLPSGVMSGDVTLDSAVLWSRADRPARMVVEYALHERFHRSRRIVGPRRLPTATSRRVSNSPACPPGRILPRLVREPYSPPSQE